VATFARATWAAGISPRKASVKCRLPGLIQRTFAPAVSRRRCVSTTACCRAGSSSTAMKIRWV